MQKIIEKCLYVFFIAVFFMNISVVCAAPQEISAEGEYRLGDRDSRETAKMAALADAKRKIIEQVGTYVEIYSEVNHFKLTKDEIRSTANAMIKTKTEEINFYENGTICKAFVVAIIDVENIENVIKSNTNEPDKNKFLELGGFKEYKSHYYKIFDEGINWKQAKKRCEDMGGHLVTITSKDEQYVIQNLIFLHGDKNYYWTGGVKAKKDKWQWITGEEFVYSNWGQGEPSGGIENIITIYKYPGLDGIWNDLFELGNNGGQLPYYDIENSGFICEWESFEDIKN